MAKFMSVSVLAVILVMLLILPSAYSYNRVQAEVTSTAEATIVSTQAGTASPTVVPYLGVLLKKHFADKNTNQMFNLWSPNDPPTGKLTDQDGTTVYCMNASGNWDALGFGSADWKDYSIQFRAKIANVTDKTHTGTLVLRMRVSPENNDYEAQYQTRWGINLGWSVPSKKQWTGLGSSYVEIKPDTWYLFRGEISKTQMRFFFQGKLALQVQNKALPSGPVGIGDGPQNDVCIDDVVIRSLDSSTGALAAATLKTMTKASSVRLGIAKNDPIVSYVSLGDKVFDLGQSEDGNFTEIRIDKTGIQGWIPSDILK